MMTLDQAWIILESLNDDANQQARKFWASNNFDKAICYQSGCFRKNFLELDKEQKDLIQYWLSVDDEFQDYFKCLSGDE
jgi:hypothetical protein